MQIIIPIEKWINISEQLKKIKNQGNVTTHIELKDLT